MKNISRRTFAKRCAMTAAMTAVGQKSAFSAETAKAKPIVAVAKGDPADAVKRVVAALGGIQAFVKAGDRVLVKPNMGFPNPPEWGSTTHPEVVKTIVLLCLEAGARRVVVFDNPLRDADICKERTGVGKALEGLSGVVIAMPSDLKFYEEKAVPGAKELVSTAVAKEVLKADCLINVPTAKSHSATGVSLGLKNLMGLVHDRKIYHEKLEINRAIAEQLFIMKPKLTVVSAIHALTTRGPGGPGQVEKLDTVVASTDPVAADAYTVGLVKWYNQTFKGPDVKHIKIAAELGFGESDVSKMDIRSC